MRKKLFYAAMTGLGASLLAVALSSVGALKVWERGAWDLRVRLMAHAAPSTERIKLILLDEGSIEWAKREMALPWPWPREVYGPILDFCARGGAKMVAFDVLFLDPSYLGAAQDAALAEAIVRGPPFVAAMLLSPQLGSQSEWPREIRRNGLTIDGIEAWGAADERKHLNLATASFPILEVATNAAWLADVKGDQDPDSVIRRTYLFRLYDGVAIPTLGLAAYLAGWPENAQPAMKVDEHWFYLGKNRLPLDAGGRTVLKYRGAAGTYDRFSAAEVIQSELRLLEGETPTLDPSVLRDAYVFFGFSAAGLKDLRPTPLNPAAPGVEVHATLLDNLLSVDAMRDTPHAQAAWFTLGISLLAATTVLFSGKPWQSVAAFLVFLPLPIVVGLLAYAAGQWWPVMVGELSTLLALVGGVVINYATEGRQKTFIKQAFRHYLSPAVIERILDDPSRLKLGGERREMSIFFSDLQGFSSISERLQPDELITLLNEYLSDMTDIILEEGGTLDKYEGDAIIAFWNAPIDQPDHAQRACRTALRCQQKLASRREEFKERFGAELHMRIGINTGEVAVGNMGSSERFDYTVLGDAANLAARLEGANKAFGTFLMVAESTWTAAAGTVEGRELGRLRVVGREQPVRVYEPTALKGEGGSDKIAGFEEALKLCYEGKWQSAVRLFEDLPDDPAAERYAQRCREVLRRSSDGWDGIWNLTEK